MDGFVNVAEDMQKTLTEADIKKTLANLDCANAAFDRANAEYPLPDDIMDYVKGTKYAAENRKAA
jgi:hypothetical protein